jgi:ribonuclease H2 subunit A
VTRDAILENWEFVEQVDGISREFGSGYPSDPKTVEWLRESMDRVFGFPGIIRFSWSTCSKLLEERAVAVQWQVSRI